MADPRLKPILFSAVVLLALILIVALVVHRTYTRDRICENGGELYYEDPVTNESSCHPSGMQGPCGKYMVLVADKNNSSVGICGCDVGHFDRPMVLDKETNQCHFIFTQAYCEPGQWLTITKSQGPHCENRFCREPEPDEIGKELVPLSDGRCVILGTYDNVTCNKSQVVKFHKRKIYPSCVNLGTSIGSVGVPSTDCPEGYYSTDIFHCQPPFDFD